jgi:hypothetical protein
MPLFYLVGLALASNLRFKLVDHFYAGWSASDSQFHSSFFFFFLISYSVLRFLTLNQKFDVCGSLSTIIILFLVCLQLHLCLPSYMLSLC